MNCSESTIGSFVDNIDDMKTLFEAMSPQVFDLFENGFSETISCKRVKHVEWSSDRVRIFGTSTRTLEVINRETSILTEQEANAAVKQVQRNNYSDKSMKRQVHVRMLKIDWVFRDTETKE